MKRKRRVFLLPSELYSGAYAVFAVGMSVINISLMIISYYLFSPTTLHSETRALLYIRASEGFDTLIASILIVFIGVFLLDKAHKDEEKKK